MPTKPYRLRPYESFLDFQSPDWYIIAKAGRYVVGDVLEVKTATNARHIQGYLKVIATKERINPVTAGVDLFEQVFVKTVPAPLLQDSPLFEK